MLWYPKQRELTAASGDDVPSFELWRNSLGITAGCDRLCFQPPVCLDDEILRPSRRRQLLDLIRYAQQQLVEAREIRKEEHEDGDGR